MKIYWIKSLKYFCDDFWSKENIKRKFEKTKKILKCKGLLHMPLAKCAVNKSRTCSIEISHVIVHAK